MAGDTIFGPLPIIFNNSDFNKNVEGDFENLFDQYIIYGEVYRIKRPSDEELKKDRTKILKLPSVRQIQPPVTEDELIGLVIKRGPFASHPAYVAMNAVDKIPIYIELKRKLSKKMTGFKIVVTDAPGTIDTIQIEIRGKGYGDYHGAYVYYDIKKGYLIKTGRDLRQEDQEIFEKSLAEVFTKHKGGRRRTYRKRKHNKRKTRR